MFFFTQACYARRAVGDCCIYLLQEILQLDNTLLHILSGVVSFARCAIDQDTPVVPHSFTEAVQQLHGNEWEEEGGEGRGGRGGKRREGKEEEGGEGRGGKRREEEGGEGRGGRGGKRREGREGKRRGGKRRGGKRREGEVVVCECTR